ncbi:hypothetical protein [Cognatilysobacter bugurensis]|uniref:Uncharacterized protein n=1 Tax=Cognatilysobacter bugurensis TaxID=543356 RepID=A0A918SZ54_9GAMM|nr:hypothetical protein [Lysobacter bugurensis]GHA80436.1 hypothetical protein GCM10007067_17770 [Lysobacter bugurensis]
MHALQSPAADPIRSRGQLELELARLAMRLKIACGELTSGRLRGTGHEGREEIEVWYGELAADILARSDARIAVYARERLKALAARAKLAPQRPSAAAPAWARAPRLSVVRAVSP